MYLSISIYIYIRVCINKNSITNTYSNIYIFSDIFINMNLTLEHILILACDFLLLLIFGLTGLYLLHYLYSIYKKRRKKNNKGRCQKHSEGGSGAQAHLQPPIFWIIHLHPSIFWIFHLHPQKFSKLIYTPPKKINK